MIIIIQVIDTVISAPLSQRKFNYQTPSIYSTDLCQKLQTMPYIYSCEEYADMTFLYGLCNGEAAVAKEY